MEYPFDQFTKSMAKVPSWRSALRLMFIALFVAMTAMTVQRWFTDARPASAEPGPSAKPVTLNEWNPFRANYDRLEAAIRQHIADSPPCGNATVPGPEPSPVP